MDRSRLDSLFPSIAARFHNAAPDRRRNAAQLACEHAALATGLTAPEVAEALDVIRRGIASNRSLQLRLDTLVSTFDDEYFEFEADGEKQKALVSFSKARAMSALRFAVSGDDSELDEAVYEALSAFNTPTELMRLVERALA